MKTLYDMNKAIMMKEIPLSNEVVMDKLKEIVAFTVKANNKYFMLLNREKYDFTLFDVSKGLNNLPEVMTDALKECLQNRGKILSIDLTKARDAYEIWIYTGEESLVYYFFPYDTGVIN